MPVTINLKPTVGFAKKKPGAPKANFLPYEEEHVRRRSCGEALPTIQDEGRALATWANSNSTKLNGAKSLVAEVIVRKLQNRFGHADAPKRHKGKGSATGYAIALLEEYRAKNLSESFLQNLLTYLQTKSSN